MDKKLKIPTVFIHGYAGGFWSFFRMIHWMKKNLFISNKVVVTIARNGDVKFSGLPILNNSGIQIIFKNGKQMVEEQGIFLEKVFSDLKSIYHINELNVIAHSMGAVSAMYLLTNLKNEKIPKVKKLIMLGAPFADVEPGIDGDEVENIELTNEGAPLNQTTRYALLKEGSKNLDDDIEILNIIGDTDFGFSDGKVSISSAKALEYLVKGVGHYHEKIIMHRWATHRRLHENNSIFKKISNFLMK
ncbi:alpha/beta hydrolase [Liquorilactobacillus cacaonum]|nr:alpha/beta hydrolase [Liquorilactobacillus cacaonum]